MGKQKVRQGQIFSPGQYNLEINFQFRITGKKKENRQSAILLKIIHVPVEQSPSRKPHRSNDLSHT